MKEKLIQQLKDREIISDKTEHFILNSNLGVIGDSKSFNISLKTLKNAVEFAEKHSCNVVKLWYGSDGATNYFKIAKDHESEMIDITDYDSL